MVEVTSFMAWQRMKSSHVFEHVFKWFRLKFVALT